MASLEGKIAVVTGGASGIGEASARLFAESGARVVIGDVQDASGIAKEIGGSFRATDVRDPAQVKALLDHALAAHGRVDVLFNNAGIEIHAPLAGTDDAQHRNVIDIDLNGVFYGLKYGIQAMMRNAGPLRGAIVNTASVAGLIGAPMLSSYNAAKFGVVGLTKNAAIEYGAFGIRVNAVCPGVIRTPMLQGLDASPEIEARIGQAHALRRIGEPIEVARLVRFLASEEASFITGAAVPIDGGMTAGALGQLG